MKDFLFFGACAALFVVPVVFVVNKVYEDGIIGRASLLAISFVAATFIAEGAVSEGFDLLPQTVALVVAFAVFMVWHLARFHRRVLRRRGATPCGLKDQVGCPYKIEPPR